MEQRRGYSNESRMATGEKWENEFLPECVERLDRIVMELGPGSQVELWRGVALSLAGRVRGESVGAHDERG